MSAPLGVIIQYAYHLLPVQLSGGDFLHELYVINAKISDPNTEDRVIRSMFQGLLMDRFALRMHSEERLQEVYELRVSRGGPKLRSPAAEGSVAMSGGKTVPDHFVGNYGSLNAPRVVGHRASMSVLCDYLGREVHSVVLDRTGLNGDFDFEVTYSKDETPADVPLGLSLADAFKE